MDSAKAKSIYYLKHFLDDSNNIKSRLFRSHATGKLTAEEFTEAIDILLTFETTLVRRFNACYTIDVEVDPALLQEAFKAMMVRLMLFDRVCNGPLEK